MGEQDEVVVGAPRWRRRVLAVAIVVVLLVIVLGSSLTNEFFSAYPKGGCRWSNVATAIDVAGVDAADRSALPATMEEAVAAYALGADDVPGYLGGGSFPADGWFEYRGRWVHDWNDRIYLQLTVVETASGWRVDDYVTCSR